MSDCDAFRGLVAPYLDGELVGEDRAAFDEHVEQCARCRAALADERAVAELLQEARLLYEAPPSLRVRVARMLAATRPIPRSESGDRPRAWRAAAALAALLTGAWLAGDRFPRAARASSSELTALAARTHQRYARGQLPLEVRSDREDVVSRWFADRVPFHLELPDYPVERGGSKPYRLEGGRLLSFRRDAAAFVAYAMDGRPITLFVTSADAARPEGGEVVAAGKLRFHVASAEGLQVITWSHNGLTYALASDVDVGASRSCMVCHGGAGESPSLSRPGI